jgi:hypothetical protein
MNQLCACRSVSAALLLTALWGLLSALPAHAQEDARRATPPPGKALVFVFRIDREPLAAQVPVIVNTERVGELANGTFVTATVSPGNTYLRIGDRVLSTLNFVAAANQSYFVRIEAIYGLALVRTEVYLVSETEGRRSLGQSFVGISPAVITAKPPTEQPSVAAAPRKPSVAAAAPPAEASVAAAYPPPQKPSVAAAPVPAEPTCARDVAPPSQAETGSCAHRERGHVQIGQWRPSARRSPKYLRHHFQVGVRCRGRVAQQGGIRRRRRGLLLQE